MLRFKDSFLCHVRSKEGAEGWSFANDGPMKTFYPVFVNRLQPFFIGKDARELEALLEEVYVYQSNYKFQSLALWVPVATIEFAILDMLGRHIIYQVPNTLASQSVEKKWVIGRDLNLTQLAVNPNGILAVQYGPLRNAR